MDMAMFKLFGFILFVLPLALALKDQETELNSRYLTKTSQSHLRRNNRPHPGQHHQRDVAWNAVEMPKVSHFAGFPPPSDPLRWKEAARKAFEGEHVLLEKIRQVIKTPNDFILNDDTCRGISWLIEYERSKENNWLDGLPANIGTKAPIVGLGYITKKNDGSIDFHSLSPNDIIQFNKWKIPSKIVGFGSVNENWGYLSTTFLNRSVGWGLTFQDGGNPYDPNFRLGVEQFSKFIDDPNLIMLVVNQHHNFTQEKVISVPLGVQKQNDVFNAMQKVAKSKLRKKSLIFTAGSDYYFRPSIRECVKQKLGPAFIDGNLIAVAEYFETIAASYFVLAPSGLGADTYRIWESLALGTIPVVERGMGLDRTFYKLPILLLDDFYDISESTLREAYIEAIYWENDWDFERLTRQYWERLIFDVSQAGNIDLLLKNHPMHALDLNFTRPLVPFDCEKIGGCGPGTKRVPKNSCAIDPSLLNRKYEWFWS